jgi:hypothetical protein
MLNGAIQGLAGVFCLVAAIGSGVAWADEGGSGSPGGIGKSQGGNDDDNSLSAFLASPVFARTAPPMRSTIAAGPIFAPRAGLFCQTMTQTIDIDGQSVHASALLCRQPDGSWRIAPPQDVKGATPARRSAPPSRSSAIATVD